MKRRFRFVWTILGAALLLCAAPLSAEPLRVLTTVPDLADLARIVGGDEVNVSALVKGPQDPHFIEARPSFVRALHDADLLIAVGLELETGWLPSLLQAARNPRIAPGGPGHLDASVAVAPLDVPTGRLDRSMGDVHPLGNPHYLTDPWNGARVARMIAARLAELRPGQSALFADGADAFVRRVAESLVGAELAARAPAAEIANALDRGDAAALATRFGVALGGWLGALGPGPRKAVEDHRAWAYLARRYGIDLVGALEPLPGIAPTTRHLGEIVALMQAQQVGLVLATPYFARAHAELVAAQTGARVVPLAHQVGSRPGTDDYLAAAEWNVRALLGSP